MILLAFLFLAALVIAITLWGRADVGRFLQSHKSIANAQDLLAFKVLVRRNMRVAVVALLFGLLWGLAAAMTAWQLGLTGILIVLGVSVPVVLLGKITKKLEGKARSLPCPDAQLEAEYRAVGHSWSAKLFPDF